MIGQYITLGDYNVIIGVNYTVIKDITSGSLIYNLTGISSNEYMVPDWELAFYPK